MEKVCFGSVFQILVENGKQNRTKNQVDFATALFKDFLDLPKNENYALDHGWLSKCIQGEGGLKPELLKHYDSSSALDRLESHMDHVILPMMADPYETLQELQALLLQDTTIHTLKKQEILGRILDAGFAARLLQFALLRKIRAADENALAMSDDGKLSAKIKGYIFDDHLPGPCRWFQGRKEDAERLHEALHEHRKVFLRGIPGIGKSELAKYYVKQYRTAYTNTLYINSSGNLHRDIMDLSFADDGLDADDEQRFQRHNLYLKSLQEDTLLVIDNFNKPSDQDPLVDQLLNYRCRILFTTRCRYEDYDTQELLELPECDLLAMVNCFYPLNPQNGESVRAMIRSLYSHTLAVELSARLLAKGLQTPETLLEKIRTQGQGMDDPSKLGIRKDGHSRKATYYVHMRLLFSLYTLNLEEQNLLRGMSLMPDKGVHVRGFAELMELLDVNALNELIDFGLIVYDDRYFLSLHPMIREVAMVDLAPSVTNCRPLVGMLHKAALIQGQELRGYQDLMNITENMVLRLQKDDIPAWLLFLEDAWPFMEKYQNHRGMKLVSDQLEELLSDSHVGKNRDRALYLSYQAWETENYYESIEKLKEALKILGEIIPETAHLASNLHCNLGFFYQKNNQLTMAKTELEAAISISRQYDFRESHDFLNQLHTYSTILQKLGDMDKAFHILESMEQVILEYESDFCQDHADVLEDMGAIFFQQGRAGEARACYEKAGRIYEVIFAGDNKLLGERQRKLGNLIEVCRRLETGEYRLAAT